MAGEATVWQRALGLRVTAHGPRREMGRDSCPLLSLKDARDSAAKWRDLVAQKVHPIMQREKERRAAVRAVRIFNDIAADAFAGRKAKLTGNGKAGRWWSRSNFPLSPNWAGCLWTRLAKPTFAMLSPRSRTPMPTPQRGPIADLPFCFCDPHSPRHQREYQRATTALRAEGHRSEHAQLRRTRPRCRNGKRQTALDFRLDATG